jgi:hypothetical protein
MCTSALGSQAAHEDLEKYHVALTKALVHFHQEKMKEINAVRRGGGAVAAALGLSARCAQARLMHARALQVLRDYWTTTYGGKDIDYIAIKSDAKEEEGRRSYEYRVVMYQGDTVRPDAGGAVCLTRLRLRRRSWRCAGAAALGRRFWRRC